MSDVLQYALFGVGSGALFALLGAGLVLIHRGSGTVNFAHSAFAIVGAYSAHELHTAKDWPIAYAVGGAIGITSLLAIGFQWLVMARLHTSRPVIRVVATLGLLTIIQQAAVIRYGDLSISTAAPLPQDPVTIFGAHVGRQSLYLLALAILVIAVLWVVSKRTTVGLAISAAAENQRAASALGWSPSVLSNLTWGIGGALAGLAGALAPAVSQNTLTVNGIAITIIAALATALFARFRSYPRVLVAGLAIGIVQSLCVRYVHVTGLADAIPFIAVAVLLALTGTSLPQRGSGNDGLPAVGSGKIRPLTAVSTVAAAVWLIMTLDPDGNAALTKTLIVAILSMSVVVVTGYAGQLSLAQFALAGFGAWIAGRLVAMEGWPFLLGALAGVAGAAVAGMLVGLPALRTRGVNLAVITFGLGFAIQALIFRNPDLAASPASSGINVNAPTIFGYSVDPFIDPEAYSFMCLIVLIAVVAVVANLRRSRTGRRLLAVRTNERAAASLGIAVFPAKLYAFALAAAIAAVGGVLLAFTSATIQYFALFDPFQSVFLVALVVIGGLGYLSGPQWAGVMATGGLGIYFIGQINDSLDKWLLLAGGVAMIVTLLTNPNGMAGQLPSLPKFLRAPWIRLSSAIRGLLPTRKTAAAATSLAEISVAPQVLTVHELTQRFGGLIALDQVSLTVRPGEVLGILGPNGAGKTTLIDAITGYVTPSAGSVQLDGTDLRSKSPHQRARRGLTRSFQNLELFEDVTVRENLLAACEPRDRGAYLTNLIWPGRARLSDPARAAVTFLGLDNDIDALPRDMSYGQRRLVALARAVATMPSVLLLDEPAAGLDERQTRELGTLIRRLADSWGIAVLLIEHDVAMVMNTADRILVLDHGVKLIEGPPDTVRRDPAVIAAYLGTHDNAPEPAEMLPV